MGATASDAESMRIRNRHRKIRYGYMMGMFLALLWGLWYVPGSLMWLIDPFLGLYESVAETNGDTTAMIVTAVLISGANALMATVVLTIWNAHLRKFREIKRTIVEFRAVSKYLLLAAVFAGPMAVFGSYLATGFAGAAFSAVAALAFPLVGTALTARFAGQKLSGRAIAGIVVVVAGCMCIYVVGLIDELRSGGMEAMGYVGGLMAIFGWGLEGLVVAKGMDISEPDAAFHIKMLSEVAIWWIVIIPILILAGFPIQDYVLGIFTDPAALLVVTCSGFAFGYCTICYYKAYPMIGAGRAMGLSAMNAMVAVIFLFVLAGQVPAWTVVAGGALCVLGIFLMFYEKEENLESIRGEQGASA
ncbi:MAG: DMT family transporter [Candidatus Methanoplasma sp.]|jgi:drug/metabolite transporter (DMT)-like permease|nr:DMT family transporter [Candidatus Methanoplasma sp.]